MPEYITIKPAATEPEWQALSTHERMRQRYRTQRQVFGLKRDSVLTKIGRQLAYTWIVGYLQGSHDEANILWTQNPIYILCHARGPDFAMGLAENGKELRP